MSDSLPERVWVYPKSVKRAGQFQCVTRETSVGSPYVPEQRALAAERERDELRQMAASFIRRVVDEERDTLRAQLSAALADKAALVALWKEPRYLGSPIGPGYQLDPITAMVRTDWYARARAILENVTSPEL